MTAFLLVSAVLILAMVALGLARLLIGPGPADRLMAGQLLGTGGVTALLLLGAATGARGVTDLALALALLAAFNSVVFVKGATLLQTDEVAIGADSTGPISAPSPDQDQDQDQNDGAPSLGQPVDEAGGDAADR
ncbi:MAG: sodium:proton antiporter [Chromatiaceae bacterium]|nr:MAG: sodium:proton antiporter [Chromatiaceae bacterium]